MTIDEIGEEDLQTWTKNKMRGFKRTGPNSEPVRNEPGGFNKSWKSSKTTASSSSPPATPRKFTGSHGDDQNAQTNTNKTTSSTHRPRFCHYFVNQGKCLFEERTGKKCQFLHEQAPMCNSGMSCTRNKCMFSHPKM